MAHPGHRRPGRWTRGIRRWWRGTPTNDIAKSAIAIAIVVIIAGLIAYHYR